MSRLYWRIHRADSTLISIDVTREFFFTKGMLQGKSDLGIMISPMLLCHGSAKWVAKFSSGPVPGYADCWTQNPTNANNASLPVHAYIQQYVSVRDYNTRK